MALVQKYSYEYIKMEKTTANYPINI